MYWYGSLVNLQAVWLILNNDFQSPQYSIMENIFLIMNGAKPDMCTLDFAVLYSRTHTFRNYGNAGGRDKESEIPVQKQLFALPYVETIVAGDIPENRVIRKSVEVNEKLVSEACTNRNVCYTVRRNFKISTSEIIRESRYADLIIINPETSMSGKAEGSPTRFVKEILTAAECPVILSPYSFDGISEIVFTYDGSEDAVFAIRQFTHFFPALNTKSVSVVHIDQKGGLSFWEREKLMALLTPHYADVQIVQLLGDPGNELFNFLLGKEEMFVVMGAFGRNALSGFFRQSTAGLSLKTVNLPFFIAHNI